MQRLPITIPSEIEALHPDIPAGVFDETFRHACKRLDAYIGALALELAGALQLPVGESQDLDALFASRGWNERGRLAVSWLLETLELYGFAERTPKGWRITSRTPTLPSAAVREEAERLIPAARPAYEVLALCAAALPAVLRGELRGEDAIFGPTTLSLWFEYFSNANPHYSPSNTITALAASRAAAVGGSVLEFGGGGGSAGEAVLGSLADAGKPPTRYVFTEPQPAFLRRGARAIQKVLPPGCEFAAMRFDINLDPGAQGLTPGTFDLTFGVNTLHLAHDLLATLANLRTLLRPGGALIVGELLRPGPEAAVHLELPFTLLEAYREAPTIPGIRPRPGFMSLRGWTLALETAGFSEVTVVPAQIERCAAIYPGFYSGALIARASRG